MTQCAAAPPETPPSFTCVRPAASQTFFDELPRECGRVLNASSKTDVVAALQRHQRRSLEQEVEQLIRQRPGRKQSDDGGGARDHLLTPEAHSRMYVQQLQL
ncbi:hypothetical protein OJAV_G00094330 [Oryzias javanicus]|uniref:Uncharacterized protein n=1 Tax=Oryzias javanicus TaxID=123683 RepID=A0A437D1Z4_ORYJA|nr:hypothetical protein OJAV_G00094330 [Oryzias javanicus]